MLATRREMARSNLTEFSRYVNPEAIAEGSYRDDSGRTKITRYTDPYGALHLQRIARMLERVESGRCTRLFITTPPRCWKSSLTSEKFAAYLLGKHPDRQVGLGCHTEGLAFGFSTNVQKTVASREFRELFPEVELLRDKQPSGEWSLKQSYRFALSAFGTGSAIPGKGYNYIILDDIVADEKKAFSPAGRESAWTWYQNQLRDRLQPGGALILIMSRWHYDDLPGRIMRSGIEGGENWEELRLPALSNDEDGNEIALWPEVWSREEMLRTRSAIGKRAFAAKYQGSPKPEDGNLIDIKKIVWCDLASVPPMEKECRYWDLAFSDAKPADYAAGVRVGKDHRHHRYITHVNRVHGRWPETKREIKRQAKLDGNQVVIIIEANGTQLGYYDDLRTDPELMNFMIMPGKPEGNKEMRAGIWASRIQDGVIHCVQDQPWCQVYSSECEFFPFFEHDDQVDGTSGAMHYLGEIMPFQSESVPQARRTDSTLAGLSQSPAQVRRGGLLY